MMHLSKYVGHSKGNNAFKIIATFFFGKLICFIQNSLHRVRYSDLHGLKSDQYRDWLMGKMRSLVKNVDR